MTSSTPKPPEWKSKRFWSKVAFCVLLVLTAAGVWWASSCLAPQYRPALRGLAATLVASITIWPLTIWARSGWKHEYPPGLESFEGGHSRPGPLMLGALEAVVFYASLVGGSPVLIAGWLVFKGASKWASWQHIMKMPETFGRDEARYIRFRWGWSSQLLTSFLFGTLANLAVALLGAAVAQVLANKPLQLGVGFAAGS